MASLLIGALLPVLGLAQSLGDAARRERERRHREASKPGPRFTDDDLQKSAAAAPAPDPAAATTGGPDATETTNEPATDRPPRVPDEAAERARLERSWRARFVEARAKLRAADARAWRRKLDVVWRAGIPYQTEVRERVETEELKQARQTLTDLEEEFRRTGLPPGWARE